MTRKFKPEQMIDGIGTMGEFWQWAYSDILTNTNRGVFAEYLVGKALGDAVLETPRIEWDYADLEYELDDRTYAIEVKSSAYVQSWHQPNASPSAISFGIGKKRIWDTQTRTYSKASKRWSDCYVFCLYEGDKDEVIDLRRWTFYVIATHELERLLGEKQNQQRISLGWLHDNDIIQTDFDHLGDCIRAILQTLPEPE